MIDVFEFSSVHNKSLRVFACVYLISSEFMIFAFLFFIQLYFP